MCRRCMGKFTLFNKRVACRVCGITACRKCAPVRRENQGAIRVCDKCVQRLADAPFRSPTLSPHNSPPTIHGKNQHRMALLTCHNCERNFVKQAPAAEEVAQERNEEQFCSKDCKTSHEFTNCVLQALGKAVGGSHKQ